MKMVVFGLILLLLAGWTNCSVSGGGIQQADQTTHYSFEKISTLIKRPSDMPPPGPYYTSLANMSGVEGFPHEYALFFSTDHHDGAGGIWMYLCSGDPSEPQNWKSYNQAVVNGDFDYLESRPESNPVFVDSIQGKQTETPHVNIVEGTVYMSYHNAGAGFSQSTLLAVSSDGVNFSRIKGAKNSIIIDYDPETDKGNGHTGYFRWGKNPFSGIRHQYIGYSLHGGGDQFHSALWGSDDIYHWEKLHVFTPVEGDSIEQDRLIIWHSLDPNSISEIGEGEYAAVCAGGNRASGGVPRITELYELRLGADGISVLETSRKLLARGPAGSDDDEELSSPVVFKHGERTYLIYVGVSSKARVNRVMIAEGGLRYRDLFSVGE